jgi:hypothetical protein
MKFTNILTRTRVIFDTSKSFKVLNLPLLNEFSESGSFISLGTVGYIRGEQFSADSPEIYNLQSVQEDVFARALAP